MILVSQMRLMAHLTGSRRHHSLRFAQRRLGWKEQGDEMKKAAVFVTAILVLGLIYSVAVNWKMEEKTSVEREDDSQTEEAGAEQELDTVRMDMEDAERDSVYEQQKGEGSIGNAEENDSLEQKAENTEDALPDDEESSVLSLDEQSMSEENLKEQGDREEEGRKEQESSNGQNMAEKQEKIKKTGEQENLQEQEKPQQVTGDVNVDFEGMIEEIDQKIEEQIRATLPE